MANAKKVFQLVVVLALVQAACQIPSEPTPTPQPKELTRAFLDDQLTTTPPTLSPPATITPVVILPSPSATSPCDAAEFVADISLPDNTPLDLNETQNKTWRIKNIGACTWTQNYRVVFDHGDRLGASESYPMPHDVPPGGLIDITIPVTAPGEYGYFQGFWSLHNANGQAIHMHNIGPFFWVKIKAGKMVYDFIENVCQAAWASSASSNLNCPGAENNAHGFIVPFPSTRRRAEDGREYLYGLHMSAEAQDNGWIAGTYPTIKIETGYHFLARVGCHYKQGDSQCNIEFQVNYLILPALPGEPPQNLWAVDQIADGRMADIDIDLSALAGQTIQITLAVVTNGIFNDDVALWIAPRLEYKP